MNHQTLYQEHVILAVRREIRGPIFRLKLRAIRAVGTLFALGAALLNGVNALLFRGR